ncbi:MAG: tetratricopeptide repeat protein [Candidatus Gastranaerophilales bacterium]|nr:tetratricopeptide repeat protein [Candidatus Gastranaerophilales bacterium]
MILCFANILGAFSANITDIKKEQEALNFLQEEDLANLVLFSEYDMDYDRHLYYNPVAREIVRKIDNAETLVKQSNISVAYYDFKHLIDQMPQNDFYFMTIAYKLSEIGFFSLAHSAMMKVRDKELWGQHIDFIRENCFPADRSKITEEVFFAGLLADILYSNLTDESIAQLQKKDSALMDCDYAKYISAYAYYADKNYDKALSQINKAISENPQNIFYKKLKAEILNDSGKEKATISLINQLSRTDILFTDIQREIDKIKYYSLSQTEQDEIRQKYYLSYYFYLNKDYQRAINELKILIMKGETSHAPELLGRLYEVTNKSSEAKKLYTKQISKNKKSYFAHNGLGDIYLSERKYAEALSEYKLAHKYNKNDLETLVALAVVYDKLNDKKNSMKYADKLLRKYPLNYKGLYIASKFRNDEGHLNLKKSISQNPLYASGWLDLAEQALSANDLVSAEEYINASAYITKNDPRYFYYKSLLNTQKKDYNTAFSDIVRAKTLYKEKMSYKEQDEQL